MVSDKKIFQDFHYVLSLCKTINPQVGAISDPKVKIWTTLVKGRKIKLE